MKIKQHVSIIIPAWNEEMYIAETLKAVYKSADEESKDYSCELIVVDDGSTDETYSRAVPWADLIVRHPYRCGKGAAMNTGRIASRGSVLVFLDADLGATANQFHNLIAPIRAKQADMVIARLPAAKKRGGLGFVRMLAKHGVYRLSGFEATAPLSGQRAIQREVMERIGRVSGGFGVEVGLTIDAVKLGYKVQELMIPFAHRETGRDMQGWLHRGKQLCAVGETLWRRWTEPIC
ncbi:glycosyltransferase family 2 protein [Paenibacillus radicis (ex Xue et al. 2023)]|uniref:Glucosyl-3-phosphoglycerate synthase n=1 Tax=Paenibacillus radicis (ex Xue et al. 2023) TaxID=2972489 RepID=A0ABT1YL24_9BACL|nr:glycosyltransferase family 2 protein [Paenibacillus radicis (ex Xue et al. 2023)]MCR8633887.1 glycosyltransferase family 2 protein [Paenibacillus radicis (ex Xue et al. 2023)]